MREGFSVLLWAFLLLSGALFFLPEIIIGKGGVYPLTKHADPVTGVRRDTTLPRGDCAQCHTSHDATSPNPYTLFQSYYTVSDKNSLCATSGCHATSLASWQGLPAYDSSAHGSVATSGNIYPGTNYQATSCVTCHDPHGTPDGGGAAPIAKLLRVWAWGAGTTKSDEELLCYGGGAGCHAQANPIPDSYGLYPGGVTISERFSSQVPQARASSSGSDHKVNPHHDINYYDQNTYNAGAKLECINCHNPHIATQTFIEGVQSWLAQPSNRFNAFTTRYRKTNSFRGQSYQSVVTDLDPSFGQNLIDFVAFCLECHDNASPTDWPAGVAPGLTPPTNHPLNIARSYLGVGGKADDRHGAVKGVGGDKGILYYPYYGAAVDQSGEPANAYAAMPCTDCHDPHGSRNLYHLKETIRIKGVTLKSGIGVTVEGQWYDLCIACHRLTKHRPVTATTNCGSCHYHGHLM